MDEERIARMIKEAEDEERRELTTLTDDESDANMKAIFSQMGIEYKRQ